MASRLILVAFTLATALATGTAPSRLPELHRSAAGDVPPIDFEAAIRVARSSLEAGAGPARAVADAELVLAGERPFASLVSLPLAGGSLSEDWLTNSETRLALHEAVTTQQGWEETSHGRRLLLCAPLPAWLLELATRLTPAFDGAAPDECELYALEPGQQVPESCMGGPTGAHAPISACLCLLGCGRLHFSAEGDSSEIDLPAGSCLLLRDEAHARLAIRRTADERHLAVVFRMRSRGSEAEGEVPQASQQ